MNPLTLSPLFSDGMVIPREAAFPVWGCAAPAAPVQIALLGAVYKTQADNSGLWRITLDPVPSGGPYTMTVESGEDRITIADIFAGDVWLCAGQSNMEMHMDRLKDTFPEEWDKPEFPPIRQYTVPQEWDFAGPRSDLSGGAWIKASAENLNAFSGTGWFFAKNMHEQRRIPIGLVATAWGGTPVESWMSRAALADFPAAIALGDQYADSAVREKTSAHNKAKIEEWEKRLFNEDKGSAEEWHTPHTDISGWKEITLPGNFDLRGISNFCGVIWLGKELHITADFAARDAKLWLGTIVDADTVYVNGVEAGNTGYRYPPRKYTIPAGLLHEGSNRIVIRVTCTNGEGGITTGKPFCIFNAQECRELAGTWRYAIGVSAPARPDEFFFQRLPMGNYNAMIAPLLQFPFKGVIWYQGESNDGNPLEYEALFKSMVQDWRTTAGHDLPFLFVQLPLFGSPQENNEHSSWAIIRQAQCAALCLPLSGMATALDLGEWNDLHPLNKKDVGYRLFLAAEQTVFNNANTSPGPMIQSVQRQGDKLLLMFNRCGAGLCAEKTPYVSVVAGGIATRLAALIEKTDTVSVDISGLAEPDTILYAWANNPQDRQLYNSEGLPVIPFKYHV